MLSGLALYGGSSAAVGVLVAIGFGPGADPAPSLADGTLGRPLAAAPVLPGQREPAPLGGAGPSAALGAEIPVAGFDPGAAARVRFRPLTLVLPSGVTAPVLDSGVHPDGSLVIPDNPSTVGWWDGGALAGDAFGGVVLAGHVDSARYGLGAMAQLKTLRTGQIVEVRAGRQRQRYRVTARQQLPQAELAGHTDAFRQDIPPRLVLITCGGAFDPVRHRYQDNLVVFADPLT